MEYKLASDFSTKVKGLLSASEFDELLDILNTFLNDSQGDLEKMVKSLHRLVDSPEKLTLYDHVRFLIPLKRQQDYSRLIPKTVRTAVRVIHIDRRSADTLGFSIRGGFEHGIGIYVSEVVSTSAAARTGLKVGDEILFINGFTLEQAIHDDAVSLVKAAVGDVALRVRRIGMVPYREPSTNAVKWTKVEGWDNFNNARSHHDKYKDGTINLAIRVPPGSALGCSIRTAKEETENAAGIYVELVKPESLAALAGIEAGDEIVEANDIRLAGLTTQDVIKALKSHAEVELTIRKTGVRVTTDHFVNGVSDQLNYVDADAAPVQEAIGSLKMHDDAPSLGASREEDEVVTDDDISTYL